MVISHIMSRDGFAVLRITENDKTRHLGSIYNYKDESARWMEKYSDLMDFATVAILGLADGELIAQLVHSIPSNVNVIIYEPSKDIYDYVAENFDLSGIIDNDKIHLFVNGVNEYLLSECLWEYVDETNYRISMVDALPGYNQIFSEEFERLSSLLDVRREHCISDKLSVAAHGRIEVENAIYNLRYINECRCLDQLIGLVPTDSPVVIVSAGPSLEKNGHLLKRIKNHLFLIVVDTAVPYVLSIGVVPDLVVTVSPVKDPSLYEYEELSDVPIAIDPVVTHKGLELVKNPMIIFVSASPYYENIFRLAGHELTDLESGGNVSSSAFCLAVALGFTEIVLVGLDLALQGDVMYAGNIKGSGDTGDNRLPIEGYYGDRVYTLPNYKVFLDWFEMTALSHPELTIYNATEGGAKIQGTCNRAFQDIANKYSTNNCNYEEMIKAIPSIFDEALDKDGDRKGEVDNYIKNGIQRIDIMTEYLEKGIDLTEKSIYLFKCKTEQSISQSVQMYRDINDIISYCSDIDEVFFVERVASEYNSDILDDINMGEDDFELEYLRMLDKLKEYFGAMKEAAQDVKAMFLKAFEQ